MLLLGAAVLALIWANIGGYEEFWHTPLSFSVGSIDLTLDLRHWVNDGLMVLFFLSVGLEISRETVLGELRGMRALATPAVAAIGGLVLPAGVFLLFNAGGPAAGAWGIPISTDTAIVIGMLALIGPRCPDQLRVFLLALAIVDDIGAVLAIAIFYTHQVNYTALLLAVVLFLALLGLRFVDFWRTPIYVAIAVVMWVAVLESGVHPSVVGVALGLLVNAYAPRPRDIARV
ncbi:MAG TPA: Na+/H+ antiporter NhaA, partial [Pseudonocardia sp.]